MFENERFSYVISLQSHAVQYRRAANLMKSVVAKFAEAGEQQQQLFCAFLYLAQTWSRSATVIAKVEVSRNGTNQRFVVTNQWMCSDLPAEQRDDDYVKRGTSEQRNNEPKNGLSMDRLSSHRIMANFWRLLTHNSRTQHVPWDAIHAACPGKH